MSQKRQKKRKRSYYKRWGYIYTLPFFVGFFVFFFIPLVSTILYSFYEYYTIGLVEVGPNFVGLDNFISLLQTELPKYSLNTLILWLGGFLPQLAVALLLASWFTDARLMICGEKFFRMILYMPGMIMASAWAMMFFTLFSNAGPVNSLLMDSGTVSEPVSFMSSVAGTRVLICFMFFIMNLGNSVILLSATIMGLDRDIYESARIDGCSHRRAFFKVVVPSLRPVISYIIITSMVSGIQMFDLPQIFTDGQGSPNRTSMTLIMYLNRHLLGNNYGLAGALSVYLFLVSGILCFFIYRILNQREE